MTVPPWPPPPQHPWSAPPTARPAPRWWIAAVIAVVLGVLGIPVLGLTVYFFYLVLPLGLLLLAAAVTACLVSGRTRPDSDAVAVGLVLSLLVSALLGVVFLAVLDRGLP